MTQCFRLQSGLRAATCDISALNYSRDVVIGQVRFLYDDGPIVEAHFFHDSWGAKLTDFEGRSEDHCEYAEDFAEEYAIEIGRHLDFRLDVPHVIATQQDVEREAARCWAT